MYTSDFCIICLTETWLSDYVCDGEILPTDYVLYRKDRPSRGGGVLIAVRDFLFSSFIPSPPNLEIISIKIGQGYNLVICCIYVPPESSFSYVSSLVHFLTDLSSSFSKIIIVGDFNFPDIDWSTLMGTSISSNCFCNFVFDCNLSQHVLEPTHVKGNVLDLVLTSASVVVNHLTVHPLSVASFSDHFVVSFDFLRNIPSSRESKPGYAFDFCKADYESISSFLLDCDFSVIFDSSDIEYIWFTIKSFIYVAMSLFIPRIHVKRRHGPKWFDSDIRHHLKCLRTMRRKFKTHPSSQKSHRIHELEHLLQCKLVHAKATFESNLIESHQLSHSSSVFSYIRFITSQNSLPCTLHLDGISVASDFEKATMFNQFFYSVFTKSSFQLPPLDDLSQPLSTLNEITFSELDVFHALQSLDPSKAMGCDGISPKLLKNCALALYQPLHHLFSLSLSQYYLPMDWRVHLIKPIFKSGDKTCIKNYRPISLLSLVSKVLEKLVYNNIVDFITSSISVNQFGFLKGRSTLQQLLIFFNYLFCSREPQTDVVYLDFRKAFDSVAHNELLYKLWNVGITGNLWLWMKAYLTNRVQYVSVGQSDSNTLPVISGVPQGSILGPLLFLIFVNDLPAVLSSCKILLFADDAKCLMPISSLQECSFLQNDLTSLSVWCRTWNLLLNEDKCSVVHYTTSLPPVSFNYSLNGKVISYKSEVKDLGLIVSSNFKWRPHYQLITSKAYKMLGLLRRVFSSSVSISAKCSLYVSLVRSQLLYCSVVWHPHLLVDIKCLELVQRRATKFITNGADMDYRDRLAKLHLLPLMMEFEIADIIFLIKSLKYPSDHFNICNYVQFSVNHTRSATYLKLRHSICSTKAEHNFYFNRIPRLWNSLPPFDINLPLSVIKSKLRKYFWDQFVSRFDPYNECTYHYLCPCYKCSKLPVHMHFNSSLF